MHFDACSRGFLTHTPLLNVIFLLTAIKIRTKKKLRRFLGAPQEALSLTSSGRQNPMKLTRADGVRVMSMSHPRMSWEYICSYYLLVLVALM